VKVPFAAPRSPKVPFSDFTDWVQVDAGVLEKQRYGVHPPRYEYVLTESGRASQPVLISLMEWGDRYVTEGEPPTVWKHACGAVLEPRLDCVACGEPVQSGQVEAVRLGQPST
jgi:hypothetical protein